MPPAAPDLALIRLQFERSDRNTPGNRCQFPFCGMEGPVGQPFRIAGRICRLQDHPPGQILIRSLPCLNSAARSAIVSVSNKLFIPFLNGAILSCRLQGVSWLHREVLITQSSNEPEPSMISMISIREISKAGFFSENPPCGPLVESNTSRLASNCRIFPRKGAGIPSSSEISLIPTLLDDDPYSSR